MSRNRIRELREDRKLTQEEVATILGLSPGMVSKHENGERTISSKNVTKYAKLFKVSTLEIFVAPVDIEEDVLTAAS